MSRQTIASWRKGEAAVPLDAFFATCKLASVWSFDVLGSVVAREPLLAAALPTTSIDPEVSVARARMLNAMILEQPE